jgi:hypothetical protein
MAFPLVCGLRAVPAGGVCAGVKYEMPSAAATGTLGQVMVIDVLAKYELGYI